MRLGAPETTSRNYDSGLCGSETQGLAFLKPLQEIMIDGRCRNKAGRWGMGGAGPMVYWRREINKNQTGEGLNTKMEKQVQIRDEERPTTLAQFITDKEMP